MDIATNKTHLSSFVESLLKDYAWFLEVTGRTENDLLAWIGDRRFRDEAFERAREFGKKVYHLIIESAGDEERLRYLIV